MFPRSTRITLVVDILRTAVIEEEGRGERAEAIFIHLDGRHTPSGATRAQMINYTFLVWYRKSWLNGNLCEGDHLGIAQ